MSRCDVCARKSQIGGRQLEYGATLKETDGTLTNICRECFDVFASISVADRQALFVHPVHGNNMTLVRSSIPFVNWANDARYWEPEQHQAMMCIAARMPCICADGFIVQCRYSTKRRAGSPMITFDQGKTAFYSAGRKSGAIQHEDLFMSLSIDIDTKEIFCTTPTGALASCSFCNKTESEPKIFKICGRCKIVFYCGVECQRNDWQAHKSKCIKPTQ